MEAGIWTKTMKVDAVDGVVVVVVVSLTDGFSSYCCPDDCQASEKRIGADRDEVPETHWNQNADVAHQWHLKALASLAAKKHPLWPQPFGPVAARPFSYACIPRIELDPWFAVCADPKIVAGVAVAMTTPSYAFYQV